MITTKISHLNKHEAATVNAFCAPNLASQKYAASVRD